MGQKMQKKEERSLKRLKTHGHQFRPFPAQKKPHQNKYFPLTLQLPQTYPCKNQKFLFKVFFTKQTTKTLSFKL